MNATHQPKTTAESRAKAPAILIADHHAETGSDLSTAECTDLLFRTGLLAIHCRTRKEAQVIIAAEIHEFRFIAIHRELPENGLASILRFLRTRRLETPIFIIESPPPSQGQEESLPLPVGTIGRVALPLTESTLKALINATLPGFGTSLTEDAAKKDQIRVGDEMLTDDADLVGISASGVRIGMPSFFDIYLRLGPGKFVKLIKSGDVPGADQVSKYVERGVESFYIRKELQEAYVRYCEQTASLLLRSGIAPLESKATGVLNQGREAFGLIRSLGVTPENMKYAGSFALNVHKVVKDYNASKEDPVSQLLARVSSYEHNTRLAAMCGMLAIELELDSDKSAHVVGMAGLLHDIGLMRLKLDDTIGEREDQLTPDERSLYETHPAVGAEMLASLRRFDPAVIQAVAQHHMRKNGRGFPKRPSSTQIHICAEILGIVDEYDYLLRKRATQSDVDVPAEIKRIESGFSRPVVTAFRTLFGSDAGK